MARRWSLLGLALLELLAACGQQSPADQQAQEVQTLLSWTATAHVVVDAWTRGDVPQAYAENTLQTAGDKLAGEQSAVAALPAPTGGPPLSERLARIQAALGGLEQAVNHGDHAGVAGPLGQLAAEEQVLKQMQDATDGG